MPVLGNRNRGVRFAWTLGEWFTHARRLLGEEQEAPRFLPGAVVVACGLCVVIASAVAGLDAEAMLAHGATARGVVLSITLHGSKHRRTARAVVEFDAGPQRIRLADLKVVPGTAPGSAILVNYDTLDPRHASVFPPDRGYCLGIAFGVVLVLLGGGLVAIDLRERHQEGRTNVRW